mgnify:FL=1
MLRKIIYPVLLFVVLLAFVLLTRLFIANYGRLRHGGEFRHPVRPSSFVGDRQGLSSGLPLTEVDSIMEWMTFDYINRVFNLPADYLKTELAVTDPKYPKITILRASVSQQVSTEAYLENLKNAVRRQLASGTPQ